MSTSSQMLDTPVGVGGAINTNTGQITSGSMAGQQAGHDVGSQYVAPPVSQTQDASTINNHLSSDTTGTIPLGAVPPPTQSVSNNTSVASPIPTAESIINTADKPTPAENQQKSILDKIAGLVGGNKGQTTLTNEAETKAGIPGLQKTVNDLNTQLEGLTNQATDLQNQASPGGAIQNQEQLNATGRGITAGGLAPQTAGDLRKNQIQQSAIASQALTLKSAIYGAQGNLSLAKDAADKAAQAQYEDEQNQINYQKAQLDAITPQLNKEEKNQALLVQTQLQDRQTQITNAQDDKKSIIALATAAISNNPGNPAAQYAAQQALAESNQAQPDLQKAISLVGQYQKDPLDTALKVQQLIAARTANSSTGSNKQQDALEQQYRIVLEKPLSNRSGGLGLEDQKVDQGVHLAALMNQFKDKNGNFNIPPSQYAELAMGLARMVSPSGTVGIEAQKSITQATAKGDLGKALTYITGSPVNGTTQQIAQLMAESIDRQATVAQQNRQTYVNYLQGLAPTGLDPTRKASLEKGELVQYSPIITPKGTDFSSTPANYTQDLADAKAAIAAGAPLAQVRARMLTKYKQVDL